MSSPSADGWADRRGLFQGGREVHEPARRPSIPKTFTPASPTSPTNSSDAGSTADRRRSSASGSAGMFANLHSQKRGSQEYGARRESWNDMSTKSGLGSLFERVVKK